jgi:hypothetical protein
MKHEIHVAVMERALGVLGLVLMLAVAWLANRVYAEHQTAAGRLGALAARRAIDVIAVIGWLADRLPRPSKDGGM